MLTQSQLSALIQTHIYLFKQHIQANSYQEVFTHINNQNHQHQSPLKKQQELKNKPQLKIDIWKVNNTINHTNISNYINNNTNHKPNTHIQTQPQYIGPILSFQRRQIWASKDQNHSKRKRTLTKNLPSSQTRSPTHQLWITQSKSIPKTNPNQIFQNQPHSPLTDLAVTLPRPSTNINKNNPHQRPPSIQNKRTPHKSLFSTVKPYQIDLNPHQTQQPQKSFTLKNQRTSIQPQGQPIMQRRNNFLINQQSVQNSKIRNSQIKRRHKIFSLSSSNRQKQQQPQQKGYSQIKQKLEESAHTNKLLKRKISIQQKTSAIPEPLKSFTPKSTFQKTEKNNIIFRKQPEVKQIQSVEVRFPQAQGIKENIKYDPNIIQQQFEHKLRVNSGNEYQGSTMSINNHFTTIVNTKNKVKSRPNSQLRSIIDSDYVPSPSELSTILKTIQRQSKDTKQKRNPVQNRKNVYLKKLNQSIRYHQENFQTTTQPIYQGQSQNYEIGKAQSEFTSQPSLINHLQGELGNELGQFISNEQTWGQSQRNEGENALRNIDGKILERNMVSLQNPVKVNFKYLDSQSSKYQF